MSTIVASGKVIVSGIESATLGAASVSGSETAPTDTASRVKTNVGGYTNRIYSCTSLYTLWDNLGGDWTDRNGIDNGPTATLVGSVPSDVGGATLTFDISSLTGDLLIQNTYWLDSVKINGVAATAYWTHPRSNQTIAMPQNGEGYPVIVENPTNGSTLTLSWVHGLVATGTQPRVDLLRTPLVTDYPTYVGASNVPNVMDLEMVDYATIRAATQPLGMQGDTGSPFGGWAYDWSFGTTAQGMKYIRFGMEPGLSPRLIDWFFPVTPAASTGVTMHIRYCIYLESDIYDSLVYTTGGLAATKLPGLSNNPNTGNMSFRTHHSVRAGARNRDLYSLDSYFYDAESGTTGFPPAFPFGDAQMRAERWYVVEQAVRLNTDGSTHDGYMEIWLNGSSVWSTNTALFRPDSTSTLDRLDCLVYAGGVDHLIGQFHYRLAKVGISTTYIGVPAELGASIYPAWRAGRPKDVPFQIDTTANMGNVLPNRVDVNELKTVDAWNGLANTTTSWYSILSGGHNDSYANAALKIDLSADSPAWVLLNLGTATDPGQPTAWLYYPDGLPASRHTYYTTQYISARNRIMTFGANATYYGSGGSGQIDGFRLDTNTYDPEGYTVPGCPINYTAMAVAKHRTTEDIYIARSGELAKWTQATGTWTYPFYALWSLGPGTVDPGSWQFSATLIDTANGRNRWICIAPNPYTGLLRCIDLNAGGNSGVLTDVPMTGPLSTYNSDFGAYDCAVYDADNDRYLLMHGTEGKLYAITPSGVSSLLATLPIPQFGVNGRLAYFAELNGVAYLPQYTSNIYFIPTL